MIVLKWQIDNQFAKHYSARARNRASKGTNQHLADYWHERLLPAHFRPGAGRRYGYKARKTKYRARKQRMAKSSRVKAESGDHDLVMTGDAMRKIQEWVLVKAYPTRFTALMTGPRYVRMTPNKPDRPNLGQEITAIDNRDLEVLTREAEKKWHELIAQERRRA